MAARRVKGTVKSLNVPDGFGIVNSKGDGYGLVSEAMDGIGIHTNDEAKDYLVRLSDIKTDGYGQVSEGQRMEFTAGTGDDGKPIALDVTVLGGAPETNDGKAPENVSK